MAAFCLGNSLSHGSVGALSDFLSPWQACSWPGARPAVLLQSQAKPRSLHLVKHSLLLTLVTQQTVCPTSTHWNLRESEPYTQSGTVNGKAVHSHPRHAQNPWIYGHRHLNLLKTDHRSSLAVGRRCGEKETHHEPRTQFKWAQPARHNELN